MTPSKVDAAIVLVTVGELFSLLRDLGNNRQLPDQRANLPIDFIATICAATICAKHGGLTRDEFIEQAAAFWDSTVVKDIMLKATH